ncbi:MAG: LPS export ABC transporter ATP-binding protein [Pseudomonadales bacterium]|jgi:lipopolysaccharide export system ATP-binding protein|nr:LPS export ABC transporter ATP-binding protein [Pseudomonadales bacterium]
MQTLSAQHLRKSYASTTVLEDVSLSVNKGEIVGLLGPNGAGKTTCFYMLVGLIKPDSGTITLATTDLTAAPVHKRAQAGIGYLPQEASVFKTLSTQDNILAILELNEELDAQQRTARLEELIAEFNLGPVRQSLGQSLSGGERRRLEIARALASNPQFILLDEPFAGVDPISVNDIKDEIIDLAKRGIGVLITDHNVKETLDICDRAYIVHQGHIIAEGQPAEILSNKIVQKVYLGEGFGA